MKELLIKLNACEEAREWAGDKTWEEVYSTCHRGDWLMWLFRKTNPEDKRLRVLTNGHIANTVRHLMKDVRSVNAVDVAIAYGKGEATEDELNAAAHAAADVETAYAGAAYSACAAAYGACAAYAAAYAAAYDADAYDAANRKLTADICRKYLPIEVWKLTIKQQ